MLACYGLGKDGISIYPILCERVDSKELYISVLAFPALRKVGISI